MNKIWLLNKFRAFSVHLCLSIFVSLLAALLVFGFWYSYPYRDISGGKSLFLMLLGVDIILGPLITFCVYNPEKSKLEKLIDFSFIGILQLTALVYGLWTMYQARPVHVVFEYDRFVVVHAFEVPPTDFSSLPSGIDPLPISGPTFISLRPVREQDKLEFTMAALSGVPVAAQSDLWRPYADAKNEIRKVARPATELLMRFPSHAVQIKESIRRAGSVPEKIVYLPIASRGDQFWTILLNQDSLHPVGWLPIDTF
ncbi:MAG: pilus assembly protein [Hyphomicrobiales bacterium]|nr:MAG: pilus assembly protein [Hyphomicrobiales bacterium]